jgi:hypothetical protein
MAGLDPAIHLPNATNKMDARIKSADDGYIED